MIELKQVVTLENCSELCSDSVSNSESSSNHVHDNETYNDKDSTVPIPLHDNDGAAAEDHYDSLRAGSSQDPGVLMNNNESCSNVELNNTTNINIKNGSVINSTNMSTLNTAINSTNANNAINESIASNSTQNNNNAIMTGSSNVQAWHSNHCATNAPHDLVLNLHKYSLVS
jgi:neuralized-like protein 4